MRRHEKSAEDVIEPTFPDVRTAIVSTSEATWPGLSLPFIGFFLIVAIFHESHFPHVASLLASWLIVQVVAIAMRDDFYEGSLFWNVARLIANFGLYLFVGWL